MQWYILTGTTDLNVRGKATNQSNFNFLLDTAKYFYEPPPQSLTVPSFQLHHHAKLTDLVQSLITGYLHPLISKKLLDCLSRFKTVPTSRFFPTTLIGKKGEEYPYYIYVQHADFNITDYDRSIFSKPAGLDENYQPAYEDLTIKASNLRDVLDKGGCGARALFIKNNIEWDFFVLAGPPFLWMARDYVVQALQEAEVTGFCFIPFQQGDDFVYEGIVRKALRIEQANSDGFP
ncbi:MAG: hypothetical protein KF852_08895 [Saprospiraceae bacterium]|nr:hypothetical protein [Saprospiraceae bacterium]